MSLQLIGVSYARTPLVMREKLAIPEARLPEALQELLQCPGVDEGMLLSTCNRVEVLAKTRNGDADLRGFLCRRACVGRSELEPYLYEWREEAMVRHVFRVTSSLDSMVFGESQILGQVKRSYGAAKAAGTIRSELDRLLPHAFAVAKRVRSETAIGASSISVVFVAADLAAKIFGSMRDSTLLLVGAGEMIELTARHLLAYGVASVLVANRTFDSARALASQFGGRAIRFEDLYETGHLADIVITATGAQSAIFRREHGELFLRRRKRRPMFFIDLAVPRNVDPDLDELDGMFVYNIDALQTVASVNAQKRQREAERAEAIITGEVARFYSRLEARSVVPTIVSLRRHFESIRQSELQRLHGRLGNLTVAQEAAIESLTRGILNKLIHAPLRALKVANESERQSMVKLLNFVYNLEDSSPSLPLPCTDPLGSAAANREPRESEAA